MIPFTRYEIFITLLFLIVSVLNIRNSLRRIRALLDRFQAQGRMERAAYAAGLARMKTTYDEQSAAMQAQYDKSLAAIRSPIERLLGTEEAIKARTKGKPS